jgi:hypothetical protein
MNIPAVLSSTFDFDPIDSNQCDASAVFTSAGGAGAGTICSVKGALFTMPVTMDENL